MRVLLPINLDRWRNPIASQLREIAVFNEDIDFYSFSSPQSNEDKEMGASFWARRNIHKISKPDLLIGNVDIVHTASATTANIVAVLIAKAHSGFRCRHIFTASCEPVNDDPYFYHYLVNIKIADHVYCVSRAVCESILKYGRKGDGVIYNGFDPAFFDPKMVTNSIIKKYNLPTPFFLFCGVLERRKRPDIFLSLARRMPEYNFVITGGYHSLREAEKYLQQLKELENVQYVGRVSRAEIRDIMGGAAALIFPSEAEGLPLSVIEASGMGLPVLARPASSLPEIIKEEVNGWLLSENNLDLWELKLKKIVNWSSSMRTSFSSQARRWVVENFTWEYNARRYGDLYHKILKEGK